MSDADLLIALTLAVVSSGTPHHADSVVHEATLILEALKKEIAKL